MTTSNYDRFCESLDEPCDKTLDPKTPDEYLEFIKLGSQIKLNLVKHTKEENTISCLECFVHKKQHVPYRDKGDIYFEILTAVKENQQGDIFAGYFLSSLVFCSSSSSS